MTMTMHRARQFPVPRALQSALFGPTATLDEMELYSRIPGEVGHWCAKVLARENDKILDKLLGDDTRLPHGILAAGIDTEADEVVVGLVNHEGKVWSPGGGWDSPVEPWSQSIQMDGSDVAYVARALAEGAEAVVLRSYVPVAFVAAIDDKTPGPVQGDTNLPEGSVTVAIVDPVDRSAVLELLAVSPGPKVYRRHDGRWNQDPEWVDVLRSVKPPPMVKLEDSLAASVVTQVDAATDGLPFKPFAASDASMYRPITASPYVAELEQEAMERGIALNLALVAVAGRELSPSDVKNTERLRRYWLYGPGAAKIRWGTPGSWRRCYRHLVKYIGPKMTPGYCTNLSERLGGHGVATHVGD